MEGVGPVTCSIIDGVLTEATACVTTGVLAAVSCTALIDGVRRGSSRTINDTVTLHFSPLHLYSRVIAVPDSCTVPTMTHVIRLGLSEKYGTYLSAGRQRSRYLLLLL